MGLEQRWVQALKDDVDAGGEAFQTTNKRTTGSESRGCSKVILGG